MTLKEYIENNGYKVDLAHFPIRIFNSENNVIGSLPDYNEFREMTWGETLEKVGGIIKNYETK